MLRLRKYISALLLFSALSLFAQDEKPEDPKKLTDALNRYLLVITALEKERDIRSLAATKKYFNELINLQSYYTKKGDLDGALAVRAKIKEVNIQIKNIKLGKKATVKESQWISQEANYTASSVFEDKYKPLSSLLSFEGNLYNKNDFAFCTNVEAKPYIIISLGKSMLIERIEIQNRVRGSQKAAKGLTIWVSSRKSANFKKIWNTENVKGNYRANFKTAVKAKFIKIGLPSGGQLHLAHVKIFGW